MRAALLSYFDLGASYGLGDAVFPAGERAAPPDILQVGIRNPLGDGLAVDLRRADPQLVDRWRRAAQAMVGRKEMELGWTPALEVPEEDFKAALVQLLGEHAITRCELTILAVGTVLLRFELAPGIPIEYLSGALRCFEFAAYTVPVSQGLKDAALARVRAVLGDGDNALAKLSRRPQPAVETDAAGYSELRLMNSFSRLVLCTDEGDDALLPAILAAVQLAEDGERVDFEYHGTLHFGWASCVVVPRKLHDPDETPERQIARMLTCIEIAHVFLGTCEAFQKLFLSEMFDQVGHHVEGTGAVRSARDLNRLRTLALAVVSLTSFTPVAAAEEDQKYFALFERHAGIAQLQRAILDRCDLLYNVQVAEADAEEAQRQKWLNTALLVLTGLTLISVLSDSYNFLREGERHLIPHLVLRLELLISLATLIVLATLLLQYLFRPRRRRKR
jgi:hypothetical protein